MKGIKRILALSLTGVLVFTGVDFSALAVEPDDIILDLEPEEEPDFSEKGNNENLIISDAEEIETFSKESEKVSASDDTEEPEISIEAIEIVDSDVPEALNVSDETDQDDEVYHMKYKEQIDIDPSVLPDNDELQEEYIKHLFDLSGIQTYAEHGRKYLSGNSLVLYNSLRDWIESIAAGTETSASKTFTDINIRYTYEEMGLTRSATADEVLAAFKELFNNEIDYNLVIYYLMVDCPYDLYWFNKTSGWTFGYNIDIKAGSYAETSEMLVQLGVSSDYRGSSTYELNTEKTSVANNAADNAQAIVTKHAGETEMTRLESYKEEICALVSYNDDAASNSYAYGDPWQLVYVFDGDDSTNVVCEGYSKAFQYLCDLDEGEEVCYLVTGTMTGNTSGSHMWNIVTVDGIRYLVDVTNSDSGTIGQNGGLFMVTASDATSIEEDSSGYPIYTFKAGNTNAKYTYDNMTIATFPLSVLTLGIIDLIDISSATITLSENDFVYDGEPKEPALTVTYGNENLFEQEDYSAPVYDNNINAGTATVTIYGIGDYTGETSAEFTIEKADQTVEVDPLEGTLIVGDEISLDVSGLGDITYESSDSSVATVDDGIITAVSVGTATIIVTASGDANHNAGSAAVEITVTALDLSVSEYVIELSQSRYIYDGNAKEPEVTLTVRSAALANGTDYIVEYADNVSAGTATVTVTGQGNYTGTVTAEFEIEAAGISGADVIVSDVTYTGKEQKPAVAVTAADGTVLIEDTDYTLVYEDNINAGTATVTVTGMGNYTGETTASFTIEAASITEAQVTLSENSFTYDGSVKEPEVTVTMADDIVLTEGTDYTIKYEDNVNAGTATVTVTGQGNYTGETTASFTIEAASIADAEITLSEDSFTYDGEAKTPDVTAVIVDGKELVAGTDYSVEYTDNTNAGTATVTVTGEGNYTGTASAAFTIEPITLDSEDTKVEFSAGDFTYDGTAQTPEIKVTLKDGTELEEGVDYELSYGDNGNINVGEVTVTITGIGNYSGEIAGAVTFEIAAKDIAGAEVTIPNVTHTGEAQEPDMTVMVDGRTLTAGTDYTVEYENNTDVGTANVTITGTGNYTGTAYAEFEIEEEQTETEKQTGGTTTGSGTTGSGTTGSGTTGSGTTGSGTTGSGTTGSGTTGSTTTTLKKGSKYTVGKFVYKITKLPASGTGEVTLTKPAKSSIASASIPAKVTIGNRSFKVTKIAAGAFKGCTKLKSASIGKNVTTIGNQAFASCTKMTAVTIKTGTTTIGKKAFYNCKKLKTITIKSKKLASVGKNAFKGIKSNAKIVVPKSKYKAYTKLLAGKGQGAKVKITK